MENNKYYTPDIKEFHIRFEYEQEDINEGGSSLSWYNHSIEKGKDIDELEKTFEYGLSYRVKYLDREDIESLGFDDKHYDNIRPKDSFFKIEDNDVYQITAYYNMLRDERENLIRIYKGKLHNYPYEEIFRGDIKNKSELKKLLKQLKIIE